VDYLDFDLHLERAGSEYHAEVTHSPAGQAAHSFSLPFSDLEIENFFLRLGRARRTVRRLDSPEIAAAKAFGGRLFASVFGDEVRACLRSSQDEAHRQGKGLRIRLHLSDVPELADLPWEYLYNPVLNSFLTLSTKTPLVRYLELPVSIRPLIVTPPLRVLVMISSPRDYAPLNVEREWQKMRAALDDLERRGLVLVERLEQATLAALRRQLRQRDYHILQFVGHGGFNEASQDGVLLFEDEDRHGRKISGQDLGTVLHDHDSLRLAVLNACEGARASREDPFAGTAQSLVQQGIPAVIAMQFEISDEAAISLAHEFYQAVADGYPVDAALGEARKALFAEGHGVEWGTPVLYLRAPDGRIFDVTGVDSEERRSRIDVLYREAEAAIAAENWTAAIAQLQVLLALEPNYIEAATSLKLAEEQQSVAALYASGQQHLEAGDWHAALADFQRVQESNGDYKDVSARIAKCQSELAKQAEQERAKRQETQKQQKLVTLYDKARHHYEMGDWTTALDDFLKIQDIQPDYRDVRELITTSRNEISRQQPLAERSTLYTQAQAAVQRATTQVGRKRLWSVVGILVVALVGLLIWLFVPWYPITGVQVAELSGHTADVWSAAFSPDGKWVVTASGDQSSRVWEAATGKLVTELRGYTERVWGVAFSPDGKNVVTASFQPTVRVWEAASGQSVAELRGHTNKVWSAVFSPDGKWVVTASDDKTARVWDVATGKLVTEPLQHPERVKSAAFSPDGKWVVTASADARVWEAATGKVVAELRGHANWLNSAAFDPDGKWVVTASSDKTARVWEAATGKVMAELRGHTGEVWSASFSSNGEWVVTASADKTARVWEAATGKLVAELRGHTGEVWSAVFSPDGKRVVTASADTTARVWD
jgi:WD40 repeat protein